VCKETYRKDEALLDDPPNGFELDSPPGSSMVYLMKEYGDEQIVVAADLSEQPQEEEEGTMAGEAMGASIEGMGADEDEEDEPGMLPELVSFRVQVSKRGQTLSFECDSNGDFVLINELIHGKAEADNDSDVDDSDVEDEEDEPQYTGPAFSDLDDTLQQAFLDYLEERGVTAELGQYLRQLIADKAAVEYQNWLQRVRDFMGSGKRRPS